jgi:hypothetical protein
MRDFEKRETTKGERRYFALGVLYNDHYVLASWV